MNLTNLSDMELVKGLQDLTVDEHENLASQLLHLLEMDRRKLFFEYSSLRAYLVAEQGLEEWQAERRIRAARMMKRFPLIQTRIESGKLNLTLLEIAQACAHREKLSDEEICEILEAISGKSCRAARHELASRYPKLKNELPYDRVRPLTGELSEVRFVATEALLGKLDEIRGLLAHSHPRLNFCELIDVLASDYRERNHPEEKARRAKERAEKKEVERPTEALKTPAAALLEQRNREPAHEKRIFSQRQEHALVLRDGYRCSYVDPITHKRCESSFKMEKDHIRTWASGGKTNLSNARYLCTQHHKRVSFLQFGEAQRYFIRP